MNRCAWAAASSTRAGDEAAQLLRAQLGPAFLQQRQAGRAVSGIVIAAVVGFLILFAVVFVILRVAMGRQESAGSPLACRQPQGGVGGN